MAAQNVGAGRWDRVGAIARSGVFSGMAVTGAVILALYALNTAVLSLLLPAGSPALPIAEHINVVVLWSFAVFSVTFALSGVVRSTGTVWGPMAILIIATVVVRLPFAGLLMPYWGPDAIWWSFPLGAMVSSTLSVLYYRFGPWRKMRIIEEEPHGEVAETGLVPPTIDPPEADELAAEVMARVRAEAPSSKERV
jgi:Na+-driven multidrug efflux pump